MRLRPAVLLSLALSAVVIATGVHQLNQHHQVAEPDATRRHEPAAPGSANPSTGTAPVRHRATVVRHVDGDTLWLRPNASGPLPLPHRAIKIRMLGIDTPELTAAGGRSACYGAAAARRTADLLPRGATVELEMDVEPRDRNGRHLVYVWRGDILVNEVLAREGYARLTTGHPNVRYADRLRSAEQSARVARRGLWGACR